MWCKDKECNCEHAKPSGLCKEIPMWASCEIPDPIDPDKIPIRWLKSWVADKGKEHSELYKIIMKELLPEWCKYWGDYEEERKIIIREKMK